MALTHTLTTTYQTNAGAIANNSDANSGDGEAAYDGVIPASTTDLEIDLGIVRSTVRGLLLSAAVDMTVKTNSATAPIDTFALKANIPLVWTQNQARTIPFTADVTKLFVTNAGVTAGAFKLRALIDLTPSAADPA